MCSCWPELTAWTLCNWNELYVRITRLAIRDRLAQGSISIDASEANVQAGCQAVGVISKSAVSKCRNLHGLALHPMPTGLRNPEGNSEFGLPGGWRIRKT